MHLPKTQTHDDNTLTLIMSSLVQYFINLRLCQSLVLIGRRKCGKTTLINYILSHVHGAHRVVRIYGDMDALHFLNGPHDRHAIVVIDGGLLRNQVSQTATYLLLDNPARYNCFVIVTSVDPVTQPWLRCVFHGRPEHNRQFDLVNENGITIDENDSVPASFLDKKLLVSK